MTLDLTHAIHTGSLQAAREAICRGAPLAEVLHPPLLDAIAMGDPAMVHLLISAGAPPLAEAARNKAQGFVEQALSFPGTGPNAGPGSDDAFLRCLDLVDQLGDDSPTKIRQRRRAFVLAHFHKPGMRLSQMHRIVQSVTGMKASGPTVASDMRRAGLR